MCIKTTTPKTNKNPRVLRFGLGERESECCVIECDMQICKQTMKGGFIIIRVEKVSVAQRTFHLQQSQRISL